MIVAPAQCRAARALLGISQDQLVEISGVSKATVAAFERGERSPQRRTLKDLRAAFEARGISFSADGAGGVGVFLAAPLPVDSSGVPSGDAVRDGGSDGVG